MEKDSHQPDSLATVTIKPDYAPSESFSSEPPPAYHRPQSAAVQVAKIISFTVIAVTVVLGCFMLASAYVTASASCKLMEEELQFMAEASRFQPLQPEALVQDEPLVSASKQIDLTEEKPKKELDEVVENKLEDSQKNDDDEDEEEKTIHIKMPLELDFDDLAGAMMEKNQKSRMNCVVEKKRAEQVVDHQPKTIQLPFGLNLTTDPKFEHISGERMSIVCESGHESVKEQTNNNNDQDDNEDEEEDTIMIQPVMIPIPHTNFQTHMPMQIQPMINRIPMSPPQQQQQQQQQPLHPMETMRPPMPAPVEQQQSGFPPNQILNHIVHQIIAQRLQMEAARNQQQEEQQADNSQEEERQQEGQQYSPAEYMMPQRVPLLPEQILTHLNRLPNTDSVIVAVSQPEEDEQQPEQNQEAPVQQQRQSAHEMNGRQTYARQMPVNMPYRIVPIQHVEQEAQATAEEMRPHLVHPRSVRSVDSVLPKTVKRVKRCSCDCAC